MLKSVSKIPLIMLNSLFWTIIIEVIGAYLLKVRKRQDIINIILVNIMTNPILVTLSIAASVYLKYNIYIILVIIIEIMVILIEGLVYQKYLKYRVINPYLLSFILNSCSYLIGILLNKL